MGVCGERCFVATAASEAPAVVLGCWRVLLLLLFFCSFSFFYGVCNLDLYSTSLLALFQSLRLNLFVFGSCFRMPAVILFQISFFLFLREGV